MAEEVRPRVALNVAASLPRTMVGEPRPAQEPRPAAGLNFAAKIAKKKKKKKTGNQEARNQRRLQKKADKVQADRSPALKQSMISDSVFLS